ncbi:MAG TPA: hypothetical protein VE442_09765 [Jatrophihabitans sp.]|nr:hypothetical protein [Jatrophihabitans sp.]
MVEIEFFLTDGQPDGLGQREEIGGGARMARNLAIDRHRVGAIVMFAAAAALAVVASFQRVYTVREVVGQRQPSYWVDGWGRLRTSDGDPIPAGLHETRWGLALCVCAAVLVVLAFAVAGSAVPRFAARISPRAATGVSVAAIAIVGAFAGLLAAAALQVNAVSDRLHASTGVGAGLGPPAVQYDVPVGGFLWFGLAGVVAGVLAIAATQHFRRL